MEPAVTGVTGVTDRGTEPLTTDESAIIAEAQRSGFLVRNGLRVGVLARWRAICRESSRPCVVAIRSPRQGIVEKDGRRVAVVAPDALGAAAREVVGADCHTGLLGVQP